MSYEWVADYHLVDEEYQARFDEYASLEYRPVRVTGFAPFDTPRYGAIWETRSGPAWRAHHGRSAEAFRTDLDDAIEDGYRLRDLAGLTARGGQRYNALWEYAPDTNWLPQVDVTAGEFQAHFEEYTDEGYRLDAVDAWTVDGDPRFAGVWVEESGPAGRAHHRLSATSFEQQTAAYADEGFHLHTLSPYTVDGTVRFAAIWERRSGPQPVVHRGLTPTGLTRQFDDYPQQDYRLQDVAGYVVDGAPRYAAIWVEDPAASLAAKPRPTRWERRAYRVENLRVTPTEWDGEYNQMLELFGQIRVTARHPDRDTSPTVVWDRGHGNPLQVPGGETTPLQLEALDGATDGVTVAFENDGDRPWSEFRTDAAIVVEAVFSEHDPPMLDDTFEWAAGAWPLSAAPSATATIVAETIPNGRHAVDLDFDVRPL